MSNRKLRLPIALALAATFVLGAVWQSAFGQSATEPTAVRNALSQTDDVRGAPNRTMAAASPRGSGSSSSPPTSTAPPTQARPPVVIYIATLLKKGAPPSTPVSG